MDIEGTIHSASWENPEASVQVPYSIAGVSTTIVISSKFTGKMMLLDVGDGALRDLVSTGNTDFVNEIDVIAITHGHFDHMGGLHSLLGFMRMLDRTSPLNVLVPHGCSEVISTISTFRAAYHESTSFKVTQQEIEPGSGFDTDFFKIQAYRVEHWGQENTTGKELLMPALGFRVQVGQTTIGFTGDTRVCPGALAVVTGTDLAIIEATHKKAPTRPAVHMSEAEATKLGSLAKHSLLIHRTPEGIVPA